MIVSAFIALIVIGVFLLFLGVAKIMYYKQKNYHKYLSEMVKKNR